MNLNDFIVNIFCETDDFMKIYFPDRTIRTRGPLPQLADSEVLTMEIVGEILGFDTDKDIFGFFWNFYHYYFPALTNRVSFIRHAANLWLIKKRLFDYIAAKFKDVVNVIDRFPIPVCRFARARFSKLFRGIAAYGKELGNQTFYGFRLHVKINSLEETIKELAAIDGAFIVRGDSVVKSCGTYLKSASQEEFELPQGLGTRHHAAAAITSLTESIAVTISESTGTVTIFRRGAIMTEIEKPHSIGYVQKFTSSEKVKVPNSKNA